MSTSTPPPTAHEGVIRIASKPISPKHKPFIIAEMSGNHNGSLDRALAIVDAAAKAGADAVKLQTYTADTMTLNLSRGDFYLRDKTALWKGTSLYALYQRAHTPWHWHRPIFQRCRELGLVGFSSAFDSTSVRFLSRIGVPAFKIASFENTDLPLIRQAAKTKMPVIISTGMASISEIAVAVDSARQAGCESLVLLKCTSSYPASPKSSNLLAIPAMRQAFNVQVGLSDHTPGLGAALASIALGATVIEKHFTLRRADGGVDSEFSLEPDELRQLVIESRQAWQALGTSRIAPSHEEVWATRFRRSLRFVRALRRGQSVSKYDVRSIRPGGGLPPDYLNAVIGRRARTSIAKGEPVTWEKLK